MEGQKPQPPGHAFKHSLPFEISTQTSAARLSIDKAGWAKISKEIDLEAEMIHSVVSKGAQDENYNKNLYVVQNSNKKRPAGLSLMLFKNATEMHKHVGQVSEMSPVRERNHNWPEERKSMTYIKKLITRPGDTFSSRAKDL